MTFVNYRGEAIGLIDHGTRKKARPDAQPFHKGWRVVGIPPGALEEAEKRHPQLIADAKSWNERLANKDVTGKAKPIPGPWNPDRWMNETSKTPVRAKPYELEDAAKTCKRLAEAAGWLRVELVEVKKEVRKTEAA